MDLRQMLSQPPLFQSRTRWSAIRLFSMAVSLGVIGLAGSTIYQIERNPDQTLISISRLGISFAVPPLIWLGAAVNPKHSDDHPLWIAVLHGNTVTVKVLLDYGADIHASENLALRVAAEFGNLKMVKLLIDHGANIHARNEESLMWASNQGHVEIVQLLVSRGARVEANNYDSLRWAAYHGHTETVEVLLSAVKEPLALNDEALHIATANGHRDTAEALRTFFSANDVLEPEFELGPYQ